MNANELADYITQNSYIGTVTMEDVATMLRQLQKERDLLFKAHSHEMLRADELQIECDRLYRIIELNGTLK